MRPRPSVHSVVGLAKCYWKLGSKPMAVALLRRYGMDRNGYRQSIKLWADMGEIDRALDLCEKLARSPGWRRLDAYLVGGTVCRTAGRLEKALTYYQKVLTIPERGDQGQVDRIRKSKQRARRSIEAIRLYDALDLSVIPDGSYTGSAIGYKARIDVGVAIRSGKIESVRVLQHKEPQALRSLADVPQQIV